MAALLDQLLGFAVGLLRFGKTGKSIFSSFLLFIYCFVFPILYSVFNLNFHSFLFCRYFNEVNSMKN
jgi:hypothetical protein